MMSGLSVCGVTGLEPDGELHKLHSESDDGSVVISLSLHINSHRFYALKANLMCSFCLQRVSRTSTSCCDATHDVFM